METPGARRVSRAALAWIVLAIVLPVPPSGALPKERVAVLDFVNYSALERPDLDYLADDVVRSEVRRLLLRDRYFVVTRESLHTYLQDQEIDLQEAADASSPVEIGRRIQVQWVLTGTVRKIRRNLVVTLKLYSTGTGEFLGSAEASGKHLPSLAVDLRGAVGRLLDALPEPAQARTPALLPFEPPSPRARIDPEGRETGKRAPGGLDEVAEGRPRVAVAADTMARAPEISGRQGETAAVRVPVRHAQPDPGSVWLEPHTGMEFVRVPAGCFTMGCGAWTSQCDEDERPVRQVCLDAFWMGKTEVTQGQWKSLMGNNPSRFGGRLPVIHARDAWPVENVSWNDAQAFLLRMAERSGGEYEFRLPTEAEWEYACRSGGRDERYAGGDQVEPVAWYAGNSGEKTRRTAAKAPNGLGLFDMSGNVAEWCEDIYLENAYGAPPRKEPAAAAGGRERVHRGGSWFGDPRHVRCSNRNKAGPDRRMDLLGFRVVRTR